MDIFVLIQIDYSLPNINNQKHKTNRYPSHSSERQKRSWERMTAAMTGGFGMFCQYAASMYGLLTKRTEMSILDNTTHPSC